MSIPDFLQELPPPLLSQAMVKRDYRTVEQIIESLNEEQQASLKSLIEFVDDNERKPDGQFVRQYYLFTGPAGSGKTTVMTAFVEWYIVTHKPPAMIALTATTNQAVTVLRGKTPIDCDRISFSTIHKLLGMKERIDDFGNSLFEVSEASNPISTWIKNIIIDEGSMIGAKLLKDIMFRAKQGHIKVIFCMDPYQLKPVNELMPAVLAEENQKALALTSSALTKVVRQAEGNPILQLATCVREHQEYNIIPFDYRTIQSELGNIYVQSRNRPGEIMELLTHLCCSKFAMDENNYTKIAVYHRDTAAKTNAVIRKLRYGNIADKKLLLPGEKLIANSPIIVKGLDGTKAVLFNNNEEFEVHTFTEDYKKVNNIQVKCFNVWVQQPQVDFRGEIVIRNEEISIIHPESIKAFNTELDRVKQIAIAASGTSDGGKRWRWFYGIKEEFADVRYGYANTVHKLQGSTVVNCIVVENDIKANGDIKERNQLFYVAYTRPTTNLILIR